MTVDYKLKGKAIISMLFTFFENDIFGYSRTIRNALFLEKEIFVNEIKHFRVSIEGSPIKKAVILSENALQKDQYKALENKSKTETLL